MPYSHTPFRVSGSSRSKSPIKREGSPLKRSSVPSFNSAGGRGGGLDMGIGTSMGARRDTTGYF